MTCKNCDAGICQNRCDVNQLESPLNASKQQLLSVLNTQFKGETFTHFAVMTWATRDNLEGWKEAWAEMVASGELVFVEQRTLGARYKVA
ncbi:MULTISPECIES: hypothetical protein [Vibrio]|uniref:hypothetical protein n=1 Tax=Vibrio TaxID=662 RepID=UPI0011208016|nr:MULTISPECIES: hypothetical protein [Vibrio]MDL1993404.1 hypothetical protein [Vibrio parahaemolyticus]MDW1465428.1 hypothetical protein [Vibrio sp. YT-16]MDW1950113.1 hypothetical protein [Vibrio sp. 812(2023)]MDW2254846.1 hypothetical protein [Vibrio sp. 1569]TOF63111.1 hypothetical protein CGJ19_22145 [Vibrio parahaemolyticus]